MTFQSAVAGTQYTITTNNGHRFLDHAGGTYNLTDIRFYKCGNTGVGGGAFYRNDAYGSTFNMNNVLFEEITGMNGAVLRTAKDLMLSGTYTVKNTKATGNEGAFHSQDSNVVFQGANSVATFVGTSANDGTSQVYDVKAAKDIQFKDAGTYTFGTGLYAQKLNINGSSVTLESGSKSSFSNEVRIESGTLTLKTGDFTAPKFYTGPDATIAIATPTLTINNLDSTKVDAGAVVKVADGYTGNVELTLNFTNSPTYRGAIQMGDNTVIKTGTGTVTSEQSIEAGNLIIREGTVKLASKDTTYLKVTGDVTLDGGAIEYSTTYNQVKTALESDGKKFYVTDKGGTLKISGADRAFVKTGVHSAEGVQSGNLILNVSRIFVVGDSTFNGYYELTGGAVHFSNQAVTSSKGIVMNGGILQYLGEDILGNSDRTLSCPIFLKNASSIQAGWSSNFMVNGNISDYEGADMTGKTFTVNGDSGTVYLNGNVNTNAILKLNDAAATNGANDMVLGGLSGGDTFTNTATSTDKMLTLNVAESQSPTFTGTISGPFNLVKSGVGTQTFSTTGIGTSSSSLNSVTVSEGTLALTDGATMYTKSLVGSGGTLALNAASIDTDALTVNGAFTFANDTSDNSSVLINADALTVEEGGVLQFGTGTYSVTTDNLEVLGDIMLTFGVADDYTKLNFTNVPTNIESEGGFLSFATTDGYQLQQGIEYDIFSGLNLGENFNYDSLLADSYTYNLTYGGNGNLALSIDGNAVPEPTTWVMLLAGLVGMGFLTRKSRKNG
ncbi:MAG: PEP-CTERM sorting domain-containing protein [Planctomycetia bacterium]|nr:PEP-CTERM sorting domain-containing protein [Planctomycetia bacterium]